MSDTERKDLADGGVPGEDSECTKRERTNSYPLFPVFLNDRNHSSDIWIRGDDSLPDRSTCFGKERSTHNEVPWHRSLDLSKENFKLDQLLHPNL